MLIITKLVLHCTVHILLVRPPSLEVALNQGVSPDHAFDRHALAQKFWGPWRSPTWTQYCDGLFCCAEGWGPESFSICFHVHGQTDSTASATYCFLNNGFAYNLHDSSTYTCRGHQHLPAAQRQQQAPAKKVLGSPG